jgi:predicted PurR-regulated permease PerM
MDAKIIHDERGLIGSPARNVSAEWIRRVAIGLVAYLCWRLIAPFLPSVAFAFALAMLGQPLFTRLTKMLGGKSAAAFVAVLLICLTIVIPIGLLFWILVQEALQSISAIATAKNSGNFRDMLEHIAILGSLMRWLDSRIDLPQEALQAARAMTQTLSKFTSSLVSNSAWAITQAVTMVVVLFYFLRDREGILTVFKVFIPLSDEEIHLLFARVAETIRVSLYGKIVVASIQGGLGGLIFWWLDLPAPAFWGCVMALLSVLPVLGAFIIWVPTAVALALQGQWRHALILSGWGILIVHPIDNFLGPVLVGSKLRLHTLLIFFSVVGGLAAFGASGIVLGPVTVAIAVSLFEIRRWHHEEQLPPDASCARSGSTQ